MAAVIDSIVHGMAMREARNVEEVGSEPGGLSHNRRRQAAGGGDTRATKTVNYGER